MWFKLQKPLQISDNYKLRKLQEAMADNRHRKNIGRFISAF